MGEKLGIDVPKDIMNLGSNDAISEALVQVALSAGKTEEQIIKVIG